MGLPPGVDAVAFDDLKKEYAAGKVVVFAGAGVSAGAGLPSWKGLAEALVERMRQTGKAQDAIDEAADFLKQGNLIHALSAAESSLRIEFSREVKRRLDDAGRNVPAVAQAIAGLEPKLAGVVTTNLDRFLERAFGGSWPPILQPVADLLQRTRYIFKPHGTIDDASGWVFTRSEYDQVMFGSPALQDLFSALYRGRTLLFVGASLTDDDFGLTLGRIRALAKHNPPTHYAILSGPIGPTRRRHLEDAGIRLLVYENKSGAHHEVVDILHELAGLPVQASPPVAAPQPMAPQPAAKAHPAAAPVVGNVAAQRPAAMPAKRVDVFLSAAPKDSVLRDRLAAQLKPLEAKGLIRVSHEGGIHAGANTQETIRRYIDDAKLVLLLVSPDYLASSEHNEQAERALAHASKGRSLVAPVILRACAWDLADFGALKPLPSDGKPIASRSDPDAALLEVVAGVRALLGALPP
jgi:SIR2-like domain/TIR domain